MDTIDKYFPEFGNAEVVREFFGKYPNLHDSEVIELTLNRELGFDFRGPKLFLTLYAYDPHTRANDPEGKDSKLRMVFERVELDYVKHFNHQNAMADFCMERYHCDRLKEDRYRVEFGEFGADVSFTCDKVTVLGIEPYQPVDYFKKGEAGKNAKERT